MTDTAAQNAARQATAALIRRYYEAFNAGDHAGMIACLTDDVIHDPNQGERRTATAKRSRCRSAWHRSAMPKAS